MNFWKRIVKAGKAVKEIFFPQHRHIPLAPPPGTKKVFLNPGLKTFFDDYKWYKEHGYEIEISSDAPMP